MFLFLLSGKKDFKNQIHVMAAALSNELGMMENQLSRSKDASSEALALREQAESLTSLVDKKVYILSGGTIHLAFVFSLFCLCQVVL